MKVFVAAILLLAIIGSIESFSLTRKARSISKRSAEIIKKVKDKDLKGAVEELELDDKFYEEFEDVCPGKKDKLKADMDHLEKCGDEISESITMCEAVEILLQNCTKPLLDTIDSCVPEKSKGLPELAVKSMVSVLKYTCSVTGETTLELLNPCFYKDLAGSSEEDDNLEDKLSSTKTKYAQEHPSKDDICVFVTSLREDFVGHVQTNCKNPKTKSAFTGLYSAVVSPCNALTAKVKSNYVKI